jgi:hypothetical protein
LAFGVHLSSPAITAVKVTATTANGTAIAGTDYAGTETSITIPAGARFGVVHVAVLPERSVAATRTFTIRIAAANASVDIASATGYVMGFVPCGVQIVPNGGVRPNGQRVTLSTQLSGSTIYYTLDKSEPTVNSMRYTGPFAVTDSEIITAIATYPGFTGTYSHSAATFTVR